ncbi:S-adenosylmethionine-dependent methyltransferase [Taxawa tesnikishii (nom. ined.)]|nr:S-adenosylmethionine-dependent methyltransferase [Dothideales sp. JES 119]
MACQGALTCSTHAGFQAPGPLVKQLKDALEQRGRLNKGKKISPTSAGSKIFIVPSTFPLGSESAEEDASVFLKELGFDGSVGITFLQGTVLDEQTKETPLEAATREWFSFIRKASELPEELNLQILLTALPKKYNTYEPMLLLPQSAFNFKEWQSCFHTVGAEAQQRLFESICTQMQVTHIARNAPIPLATSSSENILRSPSNIEPLHGDFGPEALTTTPTASDFSLALWVRAKQNDIMQIWAPRYTMFSRGNVTEKARILAMPSVRDAVAAAGGACAAVDLYAGIGYFTFSYLAAGFAKVLCWDLNPWSIEGFRRGAMANKWRVEVLTDAGEEKVRDALTDGAVRALAFCESNEYALERIENARQHIPPVRHVNCGLLPTSKGSWRTAARALDPRLGGWAHVHENFAVDEIEQRAEEVRLAFQNLVEEMDETHGHQVGSRRVEIEHIQRVKSYAPGVFHVVVDIHVAAATA